MRLWNTSDRLSPRARFDRPKAFRLPVPANKLGDINELHDSQGLIGGGHKPNNMPNVFHDNIPTKRSRRGSRRLSQMIECQEQGRDLDISPRKTFNVTMVIEESDTPDLPKDKKIVPAESVVSKEDSGDKLSLSTPESGMRSIKREMTASQVLSYENLSASTSRFTGTCACVR